MSSVGNPYENAKAKSLFKTLKQEEVYLKQYQTFEEALSNLGQFIENVYNTKGLHSSLGYLPPVEFEAVYAQGSRYRLCLWSAKKGSLHKLGRLPNYAQKQ